MGELDANAAIIETQEPKEEHDQLPPVTNVSEYCWSKEEEVRVYIRGKCLVERAWSWRLYNRHYKGHSRRQDGNRTSYSGKYIS